MKTLFTFLVCVFSVCVISAQEVNLGKMSESERNQYLIKLAKEVTKNFGPDYYRENSKPVIVMEVYNTGLKHEELRKLIGREYYTVTFPCDKTKEHLEMDFTSQVKIWKDTGEPFDVGFGNGWGRHFIGGLSYKEHLQVGIEEDEKIQYQQVVRDTINIWRKN